ncbi:MAG: replication-associated recombination protein A [Acidobacteria bacterium]|nr:replication-associated recombination protein A [Acidobacteriota bacterium]
MSLFDALPDAPKRPLAERLRPRTLDEYEGQEHILGKGKPLRRAIESDQLTSLILWGPPGVGKTTLATIIAASTKAQFVPFSAVLSGIKEIKELMVRAEQARRLGRRTVLFIDEIHRFNKAQQDAFLPYVEKGDVILIGATTENPSFEVNSALLSRSRVYQLRALETPQLVRILQKGLLELGKTCDVAILEQLAAFANGDARGAYNLLDLAAASTDSSEITQETVADIVSRKSLLYDKTGEEHYNIVSALHKSVRASDADGALYWLARMLESGEDRMYIARRLVRMAVEDIGMADPRAVEQAIACQQTVHFLGIPEGDQALAQCALYLSLAPKSDAAYKALKAAVRTVQSAPADPVPMHLRNAPTKHMKQWGYGEGYRHAHEFEGAQTGMECLPEALAGTEFYQPTDRGVEPRIAERLSATRSAKKGFYKSGPTSEPLP